MSRRTHPDAAQRALPWSMAVALVVALAITSPGSSHARERVEFEFSPGLAVPLADFLVDQGRGISQTVESLPGMGMEFSVVLDDWEFRYAASILPLGTLDVEILENFAIRYNEAVGLVNEEIPSPEPLMSEIEPASISLDAGGSTVTVHQVGVGYRIHVYRDRLRVYFPIGIGGGFISSGYEMFEGRTLTGMSANTGLGINYEIFDWLHVGGAARYLFTLTEGAGTLTLLNVVANFGVSEEDITGAFYFAQLLHISATASVRF